MYFLPALLLVLFALSVIVQFYYYLFRFGRVAAYKKADPAEGAAGFTGPISVIVSARNERANLERLLPKLMEQQYQDYEVIVVNDNSTDESKDYLDGFKQQFPKLRVIHLEQTPPHITAKKYALTMGIKHAKHNLLVFTDADCLPASDLWLACMAEPFREAEVQIVLGYSPYEAHSGFLNRFIRFETLHTGLMYIGAALAGKPYMGVGRNMAYRKSFFLETKGFIKHRTIAGGDDDLFVNQNGTKKNTRVAIGADAVVYSIPKKTVKEWYRQKLRHMVVGKLYRKSTKWRLGWHAASQLLFWITFILLLSLWIEPYWILGGFLVRLILLYYVMIAASKKLGANFTDWSIFLLDFLFVFYYLFIGIAAFFTKKTTWK
ncbi:glycosyltransferase [Nafulsella turpanensis]|uniref:glycosyltransferase n=1 Tax=Nafulsella turpanensis TaxID=1265690 RepID=UPI000347676B|nr:glycosyltransferase [Nafulsella turpanensis]